MLLANMLVAQYSGGTGDVDNPYQIANLDNLRTLSLTTVDWDKNFILTADIDATDTENWNDGSGFSPIGIYPDEFSGSFNGQQFTISGLFINRSSSANIGLFGYFQEAEIMNLTLDSFNIEGEVNVGGLVGFVSSAGSEITKIYNVNITNCNIKGTSIVGGMVGEMRAGSINNCQLSGSISGSYNIIGGLVGQTSTAYGSVIKNSVVTVEISGLSYVGGLVGINKTVIKNCETTVQIGINKHNNHFFGGLAATNISIIENCYVDGNIIIEGIDNNYIGGFVGHNNGSIKDCYSSVFISTVESNQVGGFAGDNEYKLTNCYATGNINGKKCVGGLAGITTHGSQTTNCYATGMVTGESKTGGLVGENSYFATITNCYASGKVVSEAWFSGGFAGLSRSTAKTINCFYDFETSGRIEGIGMDHNGQNQAISVLSTTEFSNQFTFVDVGWDFGSSSDAPWIMATAPDDVRRPVLYYHDYIVNFEATEGGILTPDNLLSQTVNCGSNAEAVHAIANKGYVFAEWQNIVGDSLTDINPLIVENLISDSTLVAIFVSTDAINESLAGLIKIYPNPVNNKLFISSPSGISISQLNIYNQAGQLVISEKSNIDIINISILESGIYIFIMSILLFSEITN